MRNRFINLNRKKGFSLVEVVVSILIITIVTATATTFVISAFKRDQANFNGIQISVICNNVIDCFDYADDDQAFITLLTKTDSDFNALQGGVSLRKKGFTVTAEYNFAMRTITVNATDEDGKVVYTLSKGGGV